MTLRYRQYLSTSHWADISAERKFMAQFRCECCGREDLPLDCHHLRYRDEDGASILGREAMQDLEVLCRHCHLMVEQVKLLKGLVPSIEGEPDDDYPVAA